LPRIETIVHGSVGTYGPDVADWAADNLNVDLMPWQRHVLDQQLSFDADGNWCSPLALVSTARQNGKSICIQALIGWACTEYPKIKGAAVKVVSTAHQLNLAVAMFQELSPVLADKYGAKVKYSYGRNEIELPAAKWIVKAANPSAPHGLAGIDFLIVDEVWGISSETLDIGFLPTQRANPNPICSMWSTAGTEDSTCMIRHREAALRSLDTGEPSPIYLAEYSPPPDLDPMTPEAWIYANPALGHTITMKTLERESTAPNRGGFLRSSVNLWVQTDASWLQPGQWENCRTSLPPTPGGVIACEVSLDDGRYVAVRVNMNPDGQLTATVALMADTVAGFWTAVRQQLDTNPGAQLAISPTLDTHCPTDLQRRRIIVGYQEIQRYTGAVKQMIHERRLAHTGETMLAEHIGRAVAVKTPGSIALSSNKSPGPIELARCLVWAAGIASKPTHTNNRPMLVTHNPRRVA
jgi:phage terminase large subunit-like protein